MLKWLVVGKEGEGLDTPETTITEDPLATLNLKHKKKKNNEIYAVNRFNPLFEEEVVTGLDISDSLSDEQETISSGGASSSSGYGSNPTIMGIARGLEGKRHENQEAYVTKTVLNNSVQAETKAKLNSDVNLKTGSKESKGTFLVGNEVPRPVWPDLEENLTNMSGHVNVSDQVERINEMLMREKEVTRNKDFVTSIAVKGEETDKTRTATLKKRESDASHNASNKYIANILSSQDTVINNRQTKQALIMNAIESRRADNSRIQKAKNKVLLKNNVSYVKNIDMIDASAKSKPGKYDTYSEVSRVPQMLKPAELTDRCFGIRHQVMTPIGEAGEKDTRMHDSIVTNSLLMMTSFSPTDSSDSEKYKEVDAAHQDKSNSDAKLDQITRVVIKNKHASTLSRAITHARRSFRGSRRSARGSKARSSQQNREMKISSRSSSRAGSLRAGSGVDAVRELWEKTGMKTNGRKLLIESEDEAQNEPQRPNTQGHYNKGYESDGSEVSVPRVKGIRKLPNTNHRNSGSQSSATSYDSVPRSRPRLVRNISDDTGDTTWQVHGIARMNGLDVIDLDTIQLENESDNSAKHVRFSSRNLHQHSGDQLANNLSSRLNSRLGAGEHDRTSKPFGGWERFYGSTGPSRLEDGLGSRINRNSEQRKSTSTLSSDLTMDHYKSGLLRRKEKKRKKLRCCCKVTCFLLLLLSFLLVIVAVTVFLTRGKNYFGAL